jgi:hypothetical protein
VLKCGSTTLTPFKVGNVFRIFERRLLRFIFGLIDVNDIWRTRYNHELYTICDELDMVKVIYVNRKTAVAGTVL